MFGLAPFSSIQFNSIQSRSDYDSDCASDSDSDSDGNIYTFE